MSTRFGIVQDLSKRTVDVFPPKHILLIEIYRSSDSELGLPLFQIPYEAQQR